MKEKKNNMKKEEKIRKRKNKSTDRGGVFDGEGSARASPPRFLQKHESPAAAATSTMARGGTRAGSVCPPASVAQQRPGRRAPVH